MDVIAVGSDMHALYFCADRFHSRRKDDNLGLLNIGFKEINAIKRCQNLIQRNRADESNTRPITVADPIKAGVTVNDQVVNELWQVRPGL